ncbi:hypothetical protein Ahy_B01g055780 [Arachis hypogaea]|uniref:Peptidase A2 domain-containing protein n=1 Tax=Arachis hypogaea TaxID=3818 RepID=A0A445AX19_ARAHY|nr:hypothetical protein Ahy_B01g055780 [Arachis hypogaea]
MRLRSGKIIHMADELSNVNGGSSTNDSIPVSIQQADVSSRPEGAVGTESIVVTTIQTENVGHNTRPRGPVPPYQPPLTAGWPPYGLPPGYIPPVGGFMPPVCFGNQKIKDRDVSLCPRCNAVFDAEAVAIFEKERMKKELAHREEQARQRQPIRRVEGSSSKIPQHDVTAPLSRSQAVGVQWIRNCQEFQRRDHLYWRNPQWGHRAPSRNQYAFYRGRARGYPRGRGGGRSFNRNKKLQMETEKEVSKGATPSVYSRIVFPSYGETYPKEILLPAKMKKGKVVAQSSGIDKHKDVDVDEEYFDEGDDDMVGTILIIPTEYLRECESNPDEDYDQEDEGAFSFIRIEDEPGFFPRPTERQMSHLCPLHVIAILNGFKINKVLIDGGAAISLLPQRMLGKVGKHLDDLVPTNIAVTDFSGTSTPARGLVTLTVKVGSSERHSVFVVVPSKASYNALLGGDWIHGVGDVPSTVHQSVLLWTKEGKPEIVKADSSLYVEQMHVDFRIYNRKLKPLNVDRSLNPYNCEGCYLTSEGLSVKLCYPDVGFEPTGWDCLS